MLFQIKENTDNSMCCKCWKCVTWHLLNWLVTCFWENRFSGFTVLLKCFPKMDRMMASSSGFLTRPASSMYPDEDNSFIKNFSGTQMSVCGFVTSLTIISQVLQPVLRSLCLLLQPVAVSPAEQVSEGDEAVFPGKHRRSPAQGLEGEKSTFSVRLTWDIHRVDGQCYNMHECRVTWRSCMTLTSLVQ